MVSVVAGVDCIGKLGKKKCWEVKEQEGVGTGGGWEQEVGGNRRGVATGGGWEQEGVGTGGGGNRRWVGTGKCVAKIGCTSNRSIERTAVRCYSCLIHTYHPSMQ